MDYGMNRWNVKRMLFHVQLWYALMKFYNEETEAGSSLGSSSTQSHSCHMISFPSHHCMHTADPYLLSDVHVPARWCSAGEGSVLSRGYSREVPPSMEWRTARPGHGHLKRDICLWKEKSATFKRSWVSRTIYQAIDQESAMSHVRIPATCWAISHFFASIQHINPSEEPWGDDTDKIWEWIDAKLFRARHHHDSHEGQGTHGDYTGKSQQQQQQQKQVAIHMQYWREKYEDDGHTHSTEDRQDFHRWLADAYSIDDPDNTGYPPRSQEQGPYDLFD